MVYILMLNRRQQSKQGVETENFSVSSVASCSNEFPVVTIARSLLLAVLDGNKV
jgi:hypothetical protein